MNLKSIRLKVRKKFFKDPSSTVKNIGIMFIATSIINFSNFLYHIIMGRMLGPSEYGILTSIFSLLFIAGALTLTVQTTLTKYTSNYLAEENIPKIKNLFYLITKRLAILTFVIFIIIVIFINKIAAFLKLSSIYPLLVLGIMIMEGSLIAAGRGVIQGAKRFKALGINMILEVALKLGLGIILVYIGLKAGGAIIGFMLATLFSYFCIYIPLWKILKKKNNKDFNDKINLKKFYRDIYLILISTIFITVLSYTDIILVKHFFSSYDTGLYSAAAQIGRIILFFPGAVSIVIFPRLSEKFAKKQDINNTALKSFSIVFAISCFFLIVYYFFPELMVKIIYGDKYLVASELVFKYGIFMTFISLINIQIFYFISVGKFWYLLLFFSAIILQITLIWIYHFNLEIVIWILISVSLLSFLINSLLMFVYNKKINSIKI